MLVCYAWGVNKTERKKKMDSIGKQIRILRRKKGMTQEQLAELLNLSPQAVSKWETGLALPDISLVTTLAAIFNVSTDDLFGFDRKEIEADIERICQHAFEYRESDYKKSRAILEEGLQKYPGNEILLNNLLYVVIDPDEKIRLALPLSQSENAEIRFDALRFLAYAYSEKGEDNQAVACMEQVPELYFTKLSEMAFVAKGKVKYDAAEKQKWISFETLLQMMWKLVECYEEQGKLQAAMNETRSCLLLLDAIKGHNKAENFDTYKTFFEKQIQRIK